MGLGFLSVRWEFHPLTRRNKDYKRKWRYGACLAPSRNRAHAQDLGAPCQRGGEPWRGERRPCQPIPLLGQRLLYGPGSGVRGTILGKPKSTWRSLPTGLQDGTGKCGASSGTRTHTATPAPVLGPPHFSVRQPQAELEETGAIRKTPPHRPRRGPQDKTHPHSVRGQFKSALSAQGGAGRGGAGRAVPRS